VEDWHDGRLRRRLVHRYTPHLLTGVWFGLDHPAPSMREGFGGTVAVPAWARFMSAATKGARPEWYRMPEDVEKVKICRPSGMRAGPPEPNVYEDLFPIGRVPSEICTLHDPFPPPGG
jgi:penicillin-binding protein 1B